MMEKVEATVSTPTAYHKYPRLNCSDTIPPDLVTTAAAFGQPAAIP